MEYRIDRIIDNIAICESINGMVNINITSMPKGVKEGDILVKNGECFEILIDTTNNERQRIAIKQKNIFKL